MFDINDVKDKLKSGKPLNIPKRTTLLKFSPAIAQMFQENSSKQFAFDYFKNVFGILKKLENRVKKADS